MTSSKSNPKETMTTTPDPAPSRAIDPPRYQRVSNPTLRKTLAGIFDTEDDADAMLPSPGWIRMAPPWESARLKFLVALHQRSEAIRASLPVDDLAG